MEQPPNSTQPIYPPANITTIFADGVANFINSTEVFKFYLFRQDPSTNGVGRPTSQIVTQIVMPMAGALGSIAFLNAVVEDLAAQYPEIAKAWSDAKVFQEKTYQKSDVIK
jgi:hypothetical protein